MGRIFRIVLIVILAVLAWRRLTLPVVVQSPAVKLEEVTVEGGYRGQNGRPINEPTYREQTGYEYAQEKSISSHADCKKLDNHNKINGCHRYVTEHKTFPPYIHQGNFDSGKTTAQCREEVSAYWDAAIQEMEEIREGSASDPFSGPRREKRDDLAECQNYDNVRGVR